MRTFRIIALCFVLVALALPLAAQRKSSSKKKKSKDEDQKPLTERLWYGTGLSIGGGIGVAPMVGYNFWGPFSIGPRASLLFSSEKIPGQKAFNYWDKEVGGFLRVRVFRGLFVQGELANAWYQFRDVDPNTGLLFKNTFNRSNQYAGLGYNFGDGDFGTEIAIFYNFAIANDIGTAEQPLQYRFAVTYRF